MFHLKKNNFILVLFGLIFILIYSCRVSEKKLFRICEEEVLTSYNFKNLNQYIEKDISASEFTFQYHRLNDKASLKTRSVEDSINLKKETINNYLRNIGTETGIHIVEIYKKEKDIEFYGVENCSFSIIITNDIKKYISTNYPSYIYFDVYNDSLLQKHKQCVFKLKDGYFLAINQLWP